MTQLTDLRIRKAHPRNKPYTLSDGDGLALHIDPNGSKLWHLRYSWKKKQVRISLGNYPAIDLKLARAMRHEVKTQLAQGIDPREERREAKKETQNKPLTFAEFAHQWQIFRLKKLGRDQSTHRQSTARQIQRYMDKDILPALGEMPLADITRPEVIKVIRRIESRGALAITEKCRSWLNKLFRHALVEGLIPSNPASDLDIIALPKQPTKHNPFLKMDELPEFLADLSDYPGYEQARLGIKLLFLTGVRTGELRQAESSQFDLENALWRIPAEMVKQLKTSVRTANSVVPPYVVPLPRQAVEIIQKLLETSFPWQKHLLCHQYYPSEMISENTLNYGLRRIGYKDRLTGHGIRATLSTALNELGYNKDWIEAQLSHASSDRNAIRKTYNHAEYVEQRREMMQDWADRLDAWESEGLRMRSMKKAA